MDRSVGRSALRRVDETGAQLVPPRDQMPSKIIPSSSTTAATTSDQAPMVSPLTPDRSGSAPTNVPSRPRSIRTSARMMVGMRGAKFMRPPTSDARQQAASHEQGVAGEHEQV